MLRPLIYLIIWISWVFTLIWDVKHIPILYRSFWFAKIVWLSQLNFVVQTVYFGMCFVRSVIDTWSQRKGYGPHTKHPRPPTYWPKSRLHQWCDLVYATGAFPLALAVCILFWGLYMVSPKLVLPDWAVKVIPPWHNQMLHTAPIPFMLVDTMLTCHHMPPRADGVRTCFLLSSLYGLVVFAVYYFDGFWLYPIFDVLTPVLRIGFLALGSVCYVLLYLLCDFLNSAIWGIPSHVEAKVL